MSLVAAIQTKDGIFMGADTLAFDGDYPEALLDTEGKIVKKGPRLMVGVAGHLRVLNVVREMPPPVGDVTIVGVINALISTLNHDGLIVTKEGDIPSTKASFMIAIDGKELCEVGPDWSYVRMSRGFGAIGTGAVYALGAMEMMRKIGVGVGDPGTLWSSPQVALVHALGVANEMCTTVGKSGHFNEQRQRLFSCEGGV
jgi:hypothetical protein